MAEMSQGHVERISQVIDEMDEMDKQGMSGYFMGIPVERFNKERLIKLVGIVARFDGLGWPLEKRLVKAGG